jgi:hypothetical protein
MQSAPPTVLPRYKHIRYKYILDIYLLLTPAGDFVSKIALYKRQHLVYIYASILRRYASKKVSKSLILTFLKPELGS